MTEYKDSLILYIKSKDLSNNLNILNIFSKILNTNDFKETSMELFDYFDKKDHKLLWIKLLDITRSSVTALSNSETVSDNEITNEWHENENENEKCDHRYVNLSHKSISNEEAVNQLLIISKILYVYAVSIKSYRDNNILLTLQYLHDLLIPLNDDIKQSKELKQIVAQICEYWWINEEKNAENYLPQLLPYLLLLTLHSKVNDVDIKRLYILRDALLLFDFNDLSIETLKSLLLRCFIHPSYLKLTHGKKFLSYVINLSESNLQDAIFDIIKSQLINCNQYVCIAYGDMLFKSWKDNSNYVLLEDNIQSLLEYSILTTNNNIFKSIRLVLSTFLSTKRDNEIDILIYRLYSPFIWRYMTCANALIRLRCSILLYDIFPIQSHQLSEDNDTLIQKQFNYITDLLKDPDHRVRAASTTGVCTILSVYWITFPINEIKKIIQYLINSLLYDISSITIRSGVLIGLTKLLEQPMTHQLLLKLLPLISNTIYDKNEKIRQLFLELLVKLQSLGHNSLMIVSLKQLFHTLIEDKSKKVRQVAVQLLSFYFYPKNNENLNDIVNSLNTYQSNQPTNDLTNQLNQELSIGQLQLQLSIILISLDIEVAENFYGLLYTNITIGSVAKLCVMLYSYIHSITNHNKESNKRNYNNRLDSNESTNTEPKIRLGLLRILAVSLASIKDKLCLSNYGPSKDLINKYITTDTIRSIISYYINNCSYDSSYVGELVILYDLMKSANFINTSTTKSNKKSNKNLRINSTNSLLNDELVVLIVETTNQVSNSLIDQAIVNIYINNVAALLSSYNKQGLVIGLLVDKIKSMKPKVNKKKLNKLVDSQNSSLFTAIKLNIAIIKHSLNDETIIELPKLIHEYQVFADLAIVSILSISSDNETESSKFLVDLVIIYLSMALFNDLSNNDLKSTNKFNDWLSGYLLSNIMHKQYVFDVLSSILLHISDIFNSGLDRDIHNIETCGLVTLAYSWLDMLSNNISSEISPKTIFKLIKLMHALINQSHLSIRLTNESFVSLIKALFKLISSNYEIDQDSIVSKEIDSINEKLKTNGLLLVV